MVPGFGKQCTCRAANQGQIVRKMVPATGQLLLAKTVASDRGAIALNIVLAQVGQQATAAADQLQQTTARMMILPMFAEVSRKSVDPLGQQRNLDLWRTGVRVMHAMVGNDFVFLCLLQRHAGGASSGHFWP
jgi:hypothetical protein